MKIVYTSLILPTLIIISCHGRLSKPPVELDTAKLASATADSTLTTLRLILGPRLKPNGYFFGAAGVSSNGEVLADSIRSDPAYTKTGISVYYRYLEGNDVKTDTFQVDFGPKDSLP